jgi:hypothetical protein
MLRVRGTGTCSEEVRIGNRSTGDAALRGDTEPRKLKIELASSIDSKKCGI